MKKKNKKFYPYSLGSCSILLIFVIICLTTFAGLSLVSANSDYKMSQKTAENTTQYYRADHEALLVYSRLKALAENSSFQEFLSACETDINDVDGLLAQQDGKKIKVTYTVPINERQYLEVNVTLEEEHKIQIDCWKVQTKIDESEEQPLPVWDGTPR